MTVSNRKKGSGTGTYKLDRETQELFKKMTPQKLAIIIALLTDALRVRAVLLDVDQNVEVVLQGNLKGNEVNTLLKELNNIPLEKWLAMLQKFNKS
jgi:hypothetical protein